MDNQLQLVSLVLKRLAIVQNSVLAILSDENSKFELSPESAKLLSDAKELMTTIRIENSTEESTEEKVDEVESTETVEETESK